MLLVSNVYIVSCSFRADDFQGTIVETFAQNIATLAAGSVIYQIGYTIVMLMVEVVIADLTSLRSRLFFSYIPAAPFIVCYPACLPADMC